MASIPTKTELETMDYSYQGQPFVNVPAKENIDTTTMDYSYLAQPFVTNPAGGGVVITRRRASFIKFF